MKNVEDAIFRLQNFLNRGRGENEEGLELAQVQQTHEGIDVSGVEEDASEGGA